MQDSGIKIRTGKEERDAVYHRSRIKGKNLCPRPAKRRDPKTFLQRLLFLSALQ
jgi:hypothetical protein